MVSVRCSLGLCGRLRFSHMPRPEPDWKCRKVEHVLHISRRADETRPSVGEIASLREGSKRPHSDSYVLGFVLGFGEC